MTKVLKLSNQAEALVQVYGISESWAEKLITALYGMSASAMDSIIVNISK